MLSKKQSWFIFICLAIFNLILVAYWLQIKSISSVIPQKTSGKFVLEEVYINDLITEKGVGFALDNIKQALKDGQVSISQCHTAVHLAGHKAYSVSSNNLTGLVKEVGPDLTLCGGAFQHGIEAEITSAIEDPTASLHEFCRIVQEAGTGTNCFHGVGHASIGNTLDVIKSLEYCDKVVENTAQSAYNCYEGVFSEYAFQIAGIDGDTGLAFPNGPTMRLPTKYPMDYCQTLGEKYQLACAAQLSRMVSGASEVENPLELCLKTTYSYDVQFGCLRIVSAVIAQQELSSTSTVKVPNFILSLSSELKRAYIVGIAGEYRAFITSGVEKDWQPICNHFKEKADFEVCQKAMQGNFDVMSSTLSNEISS
jgi:hypothetical protein